MTLSMQNGQTLKAWDWLNTRKPLHVLGHTIFIYDIAQDVEAHGRIAQIHYFQGEYPKALHEARRVLEIDPKDKLGQLLLKSIQKKIAQNK
jgi:tetratricopeptide (TPR) repeat protein